MDRQEQQHAAKPGPTTTVFWNIAGIDAGTMIRCPPHDWAVGRTLGILMSSTALYQTGLFSLIGHKLYAAPDQFRPEIILVAALLATFIMQIDSFMIMRSEWFLSGVEWLKKCGIDISGGSSARVKVAFGLAIRVVLSVGIAQLTAIFVSLLIFGADIKARIDADYLTRNAAVIANANTIVDGQIGRATQAFNAENANLVALSKQVTAVRQNEIDPSANDPAVAEAEQEVKQLIERRAKDADDVRAAETFASNEQAGIKRDASNSGQVGQGPRYKAALDQLASAKTHAQETDTALTAARARLDALRNQHAAANEGAKQQSHSQRPEFESALTAEEAKVAALKAQLDSLTQGREEAIRKTVESAPDHAERANGFLAQITALERIAEGDNKIAAVILLIDVTSFGFELAAVLAKVTSFVPTVYGALLASETFMRIAWIADEMETELNGGERTPAVEPESRPVRPVMFEAANDNDILRDSLSEANPFDERDDTDTPPDPPKRGRGRPRKSSLN